MDGNGRWAQSRGLPRTAGHRKGIEAARRVVRGAAELEISYLTLFGFSSENWKRPESEVTELMGLLRHYLKSEADELGKNGVRVCVIGDRRKLSSDIVKLIERVEDDTKANTRLTLVVALSYGSRAEITEAARILVAEAIAGRLDPSELNEDVFARHLATEGIPDPDLVIRTSGEQRLSNFLLWQAAYSELVFTDVYWPDFSKQHLQEAIDEYHSRERRYGASSG
jgi:undecaprenyl diphosphate synthase